jgi:hypothetical protein
MILSERGDQVSSTSSPASPTRIKDCEAGFLEHECDDEYELVTQTQTQVS